jgi:hypothetical protein
MYRYPERPLRVVEFECQRPPEARAELGQTRGWYSHRENQSRARRQVTGQRPSPMWQSVSRPRRRRSQQRHRGLLECRWPLF